MIHAQSHKITANRLRVAADLIECEGNAAFEQDQLKSTYLMALQIISIPLLTMIRLTGLPRELAEIARIPDNEQKPGHSLKEQMECPATKLE